MSTARARWLWLDHLDPDLGLAREERQAVRRRARTLALDGSLVRPTAPAVAAMVLVPTVVFLPLYAAIMLRAGIPWLVAAMLAGIAAEWILVAWLVRWLWRPCLLAALRERGIDVCPACGYDLRGDPTSVVCPECGTARTGAGEPSP